MNDKTVGNATRTRKQVGLLNEKGAITLFVLISCTFMLIIALLVNIGVINKRTAQEKELAKITKSYEVSDDEITQVYEETSSENPYVTLAEVKELIEQSKLEMYPIGSIYISTNSKNPSEYIGGTWQSYGEGRTLVGYQSSDSDFSTVEKTGGEKSHILTIQEMPSHSHRSPIGRARFNLPNTGTSNSFISDYSYNYENAHNYTTSDGIITGTTGESAAHNNLQPYIVTYMWKRIS